LIPKGIKSFLNTLFYVSLTEYDARMGEEGNGREIV